VSLKKYKIELRKKMRTKPKKFQGQGIRFLDQKKRAILGDEMGLGKTIQVLGLLAIRHHTRPVVIVCPANAKYVWEEQMEEHTKFLECVVVSGRKPYPVDKDIIIINYDIVSYWADALLKLKPKALIMDECQKIKNRKSLRTKACKKLSKHARILIPLSGTPIVNRPVEYFPVLNMLYPNEFRSFWKFAFRYCNPRKGFKGRGWLFDGATNIDELRERVAPFFIRRLMDEVGEDLPNKERILIPVDIDNLKEYEKVRDDFVGWLKERRTKRQVTRAMKAEEFVRVGQLRQIIGQGKIKPAIAWIKDYLEDTGKKLAVFCYHRKVLAELVKAFPGSAVGGKSGEKRKQEVKKFQTKDSCRLFLGTIGADKEAITLTAADATLTIELWWVPGDHDQVDNRVRRIGQTSSKVFNYYLTARDTIDDMIWKVLNKKRKVIERLLDGKDVSDIKNHGVDIYSLLNKSKNQSKKETKKYEH